MKIFYSWQSWSPDNENRNLIERAIKEAIKQTNTDLELESAQRDRLLEFDKDTRGVPGSPPIFEKILRKIDECFIFVCDASLILSLGENKAPNPNVMVELGYALAQKGWERIIIIHNNAYGIRKELPFDMGLVRTLEYDTSTDKSKTQHEKDLASAIANTIRLVMQDVDRVSQVSVLQQFDGYIQSANAVGIEEAWRSEVRKAYDNFTSEEFYSQRKEIINDDNRTWDRKWHDILDLYFESCKNSLKIASKLVWHWESSKLPSLVSDTLKLWARYTENVTENPVQWRFLPALLLTYIIGTLSLKNEKSQLLLEVIQNIKIRNPDLAEKIPSLSIILTKTLIKYVRDRNDFKKSQENIPPLNVKLHGYVAKTIEPCFTSKEDVYLALDEFEVLLAVTYFYQNPNEYIPLPTVAFDWELERSADDIREFWYEAGKRKAEWWLLKNGWLDGNEEIAFQTLQAFRTRRNRNRYLRSLTSFPDIAIEYSNGRNDGGHKFQGFVTV